MAGYLFCPYCGVRYEKQGEVQTCRACRRTVWHNSAPCAGVLIVREGRLLLVKRGIEPFKGWWDIPGGFLQLGEPPTAGAAREALEETGLQVAIEDFIGVYVDRYGDDGRYTLNFYYTAQIIGGELKASDDAVEIGWFGPDELPDQIAFDNGRRAIADWRRLTQRKPIE